ncbi:hypothetical protein HYV80_03820 [Candidatus Woesearchaeota archaeon]|nr:hypothetical protein [Candidatus Woesearchaeota archaeon]
MISIFGKYFFRGKNLGFTLLNRKFRHEFDKIKQQFEEHLQAINENTGEIASNFEYVNEMESKLDRLSERIDKIQMFLESSSGIQFAGKTDFDVKRLNRKEQEVFLVIYTLEEEKGNLAYEDIASRLGVSEHLAASYVTSLIEKGVPIVKRYINNRPYFRLDPDFKTLQTKENILQLSLDEFGF